MIVSPSFFVHRGGRSYILEKRVDKKNHENASSKVRRLFSSQRLPSIEDNDLLPVRKLQNFLVAPRKALELERLSERPSGFLVTSIFTRSYD